MTYNTPNQGINLQTLPPYCCVYVLTTALAQATDVSDVYDDISQPAEASNTSRICFCPHLCNLSATI
ncbi:hypothetical protein E2C01_049267 [Portunus trituberculatus]|uniref:Uncharacterized protein n=1 Tax=Portunus trituberculatus TaxID=210409 RepID=A0A5B7GFL6_PORTR|nr:hypothetical protein [Portunus trituberculatus]